MGFPPSTPLGHRQLGHIPCQSNMQSIVIEKLEEATLEVAKNGGYKLTARVNGSKTKIDAWISKSLQADCKNQKALVERLKSCKDINLGASAEVNENGNTIIKYWVTKPSSLKLVATW